VQKATLFFFHGIHKSGYSLYGTPPSGSNPDREILLRTHLLHRLDIQYMRLKVQYIGYFCLFHFLLNITQYIDFIPQLIPLAKRHTVCFSFPVDPFRAINRRQGNWTTAAKMRKGWRILTRNNPRRPYTFLNKNPAAAAPPFSKALLSPAAAPPLCHSCDYRQ